MIRRVSACAWQMGGYAEMGVRKCPLCVFKDALCGSKMLYVC